MDRGTWQAGLQSIELKRVWRDWATNTFTSWLLRSLTLTWGGHIQSYSTRMTIPPTLRCPKASCLMDGFCCIIFLCVLLKIRSGQGAFSIAHRALSGCTKRSLTFEWFLNCSLHFAKVDLVISSVQMSQFPHMAYNISNWENSFTGILQKVQALNRCYWKRRYSDLQRTEMHSENDRMKLAINADREEVETQVMWPGGLGM